MLTFNRILLTLTSAVMTTALIFLTGCRQQPTPTPVATEAPKSDAGTLTAAQKQAEVRAQDEAELKKQAAKKKLKSNSFNVVKTDTWTNYVP